MATTTDLEKLVINYLTQDQYDDAREAGTLNANELYLTPDTGSTGGTVTSVAVANGGALSVSGSPITTSGTITISHADTSSQSSVSNSGRTYIQSVTLDTYGHVTGLSSATETVTNSDEKLGTDAVTSGTTYYIIAGTNTTGAERKKYDASGIAYKATNGTANGTNGEALLTLGNSTASTSANWKAGKIFLYSSSAYGGTLVPEAVTSSSKTWTLPNKTGTIALTSDIPDTSSFITVDEKLKWTASTTSNTYYPIQSTSTAATSTASTLNGISFYQYYNTAGGYRRLDLGNATAWKSTGGAYGTIRLYGAAATYYGDLIPGVLGTTSGDGHLTANRTWTFPNASGTVALTSDIPTVPTKTSQLTNDGNGTSAFATMDDIGSFGGGTVTSITLKAGSGITLDTDNTAITTTGTRTISHADTSSQSSSSNSGRTYIQSLTLDTYGHVTGISTATETVTNTDENVKSTAVTAATTNYIVGSTTSTTTTGGLSKHASAVLYTTADSGTSGYTQLRLGNTTATSSAGGKEGQIRLYGTNATYYLDLKPGAIASSNKTITFPNKTGTVALTDDIPDVSGFITTDSDEKLKTVALTSGTIYYPILATGANAAANRQVDSAISGLKYVSSAGTTSAVGAATLYLGNSTASGTANNEQGVLRLYGTTAYYHDIKGYTGYPTGNRTIYLPRYTSTMYLTCVSTTNAVGGATTAPVYVDDTGRIQAVTSIPYSLLTGTPTIPTVPLEGVQMNGTDLTITNKKVNITNYTVAGTSSGIAGLVPAPPIGNVHFLTNKTGWTATSTGSSTVNNHPTYDLYVGSDTAWRLNIDNATSSLDGYMSSTDKSKLDAIETTYLPLTGGDLSGNLRLNADSGVGRWTITRQNDVSVMSSGVNTAGLHGLFSDKGSRWMIQAPADGSSVTINDGISSNTYIAGNLTIYGQPLVTATAEGDTAYFVAQRTDGTFRAHFGCGANNGRHGIYSSSSADGIGSKWIIMRDETGDIFIGGNTSNYKVHGWVNASASSGDWYYRKFSDGTFDAWGAFTVTPTSSTASGNIYYSNVISVSLPFTVTEANITGSVGAQYAWIVNTSSASTTVSFRIARGIAISTSTALTVKLHVHGRY